MDDADEIKTLRQRMHDVSAALQKLTNDLTKHDFELDYMRTNLDSLATTTATRDQLASASELMTVKLGQVREEVAEVRKWVIAGVSVVMGAVILAVIALVVAPR